MSTRLTPGERFEWLETAAPRLPAPTVERGAEAEPAWRCRQCGWLDSIRERECFRCGGPLGPEQRLPEGLPPPPEDGIQLDLRPAADSLAAKARSVDPATWLLRRRAAERSRLPGFETLLALAEVNTETFHRFAHQQAVARKALREMGGAALLADETGLGKTIEAGLVIKELLLRGLAQTVLVVVPASLGLQWQEEMKEKFRLDFVVVREGRDLKGNPPLVIVSYAGLRSEKGVGKMLRERSTDLLVCDEAHHLKNRSTKQYKAVGQIQKKYVLLLSATPFHNKLVELKNLLDVLKPGLLGSTRAFNKQYVDEKDPRKPRNLHHLRALLGEVMIRNRRSEVAVKLPPRRAVVYHVSLAPEEQAFYDELSEFIGNEVRTRAASYHHEQSHGSYVLTLINLQRQLCSSPQAVASGLRNLSQNDALPVDVVEQLRTYVDRADQLGGLWRKARAIEEIVEKFPEKIVVFCEFRATIRHLVDRLKAAGIPALSFHGGHGPQERARRIQRFREEGRILVASRAGAEGLNLQFCSTVVNFDLPWNPMIVEQRIGRVHRLGQTRPVKVVNISVKGTIEARILELLTNKLKLFTAVLGEVDLILGSLHSEKSFEELLREAWLSGTSSSKLDASLESFGEALEQARGEYDEIKQSEVILDTLVGQATSATGEGDA
ncbi:MAG: DEAD/DEAH box helicase [Planctomycetes bacterium]|nr:DEAD/DEAH box helicase [Planctomycetota bacterium]